MNLSSYRCLRYIINTKTIVLWYRWDAGKKTFVFNHIEDVSIMGVGNLPLLCVKYPNLTKWRWAKETALQIDNEIVYMNDPKAEDYHDQTI